MAFEDDYAQEPLPEESQSPGGFPPSSGLPPDAMGMLAGMPMGGGQLGPPSGGMGGPPGMGGAPPPPPGPMGSGQGAGAPMEQGMSGGMGGPGNMIGDGRIPSGPMAMAGNPGTDPMMAVKQQFEAVTTELQMLAAAYPMAGEDFMAAGEAIARGMLKIAQGIQPNPAAPPMPA